MKRLLASTAILLAVSGPLAAQTAAGGFMQTAAQGDMYGTNLIGQRLYVSEAPFAADNIVTAEMRGQWDDVGEINDLLLSQSGQVKAVLLDIGGFLGIGEHTIAVDMSQLHFLVDQTDPGDVFVAINGTKDSLENAPTFQRIDRPGGITQTGAGTATPTAVGTATTAVVPVTTAETNNAGMTDNTAATTGTVQVQTVQPQQTATTAVAPVMAPLDPNLRMARPDIARDNYQNVEPQVLTADMLNNAEVYGVNDEEIGEISDLVLDTTGQISQAIVDVGGFLGIGEHEVAIGLDEMQIVRDQTGNDVRVYINATEDNLNQRPIYQR